MIPQLTRDDITRLGGELKRIAESEAFETAINLLRSQYQDEFFNSDQNDTSARENAYRLNRATDDLVATLNSMAVIAEQEQERLEYETE